MVGSRPRGYCWPPLYGPLLVLVAAPVAAVGVGDGAVGRNAVYGVLLDAALQVLGVDRLVLAQPEAGHHLPRGLGDALQVVGGAGGDLVEDHPLCGPAT